MGTALTELQQLLAEEGADDWDYNRDDDVRNILCGGHWVRPEEISVPPGPIAEGGSGGPYGYTDMVPRYYEGGHWAPDEGYWAMDKALELERGRRIAALLTQIDREQLTELTLSLSVCPMHFGDYAGCFDDDEEECRGVRAIHPAHDT